MSIDEAMDIRWHIAHSGTTYSAYDEDQEYKFIAADEVHADIDIDDFLAYMDKQGYASTFQEAFEDEQDTSIHSAPNWIKKRFTKKLQTLITLEYDAITTHPEHDPQDRFTSELLSLSEIDGFYDGATGFVHLRADFSTIRDRLGFETDSTGTHLYLRTEPYQIRDTHQLELQF